MRHAPTTTKGIRPRGASFHVNATLKGERRTGTAHSLEEAIALRHRLIADMVKGRPSAPSLAVDRDPTAWTLSKAVRYAMTHHWKGEKSEQTAQHMADAALRYWGKTFSLAALDLEQLDRYVLHLEGEGNANSTINRKMSALGLILRMAHERGGCSSPPPIRRRKEIKNRIRYISETEEGTMLGLLLNWGKTDHHDALSVLIDTGLRMGELWSLEWKDVDLKRGLISIWENKTDHPRGVPMTQRVKDILSRRKWVYSPAGPAFRPFPYTNSWFRVMWERLESHMGLADDPGFRPYCTRHTCASRLVQRGVSLQVVQQWLGHKSIQMTLRYACLAPTQLMDAAKVLDQ